MQLVYPNRPLYWHDLVYQLQDALSGQAGVYLVGGTVRDAYRDRPFKDIDLACAGDGKRVARTVANAFKGDYYALDAERGIGRAIIQYGDERWIIDAASFRGEDLLADLRDRDFTFNAMAVPLDTDLEGIFDPLGGIPDIQEKILRRCSPQSIADDPIRSMRAIRQSLAYGYRIEPETLKDIRREGPRIQETSPERIRDEFLGILNGVKAQAGIAALDMLGLLDLIMPEAAQAKNIPHLPHMDRWRYTLAMMDNLSILLTVISPRRDDNTAASAGYGTFVYLLDRFRGFLQGHTDHIWPNERTHRMLLMLAVILIYCGVEIEQALARAAALRLSSDEIKRIREIMGSSGLPQTLHEKSPLTERDVYRFWRHNGEAGIDACLISAVDYMATAGTNLSVPDWTRFLQTLAQLLEGYENAMTLKPLVSGSLLMEKFNLNPGPLIGELLEVLREAQALGEISTGEEGLRLAETWLAETNR